MANAFEKSRKASQAYERGDISYPEFLGEVAGNVGQNVSSAISELVPTIPYADVLMQYSTPGMLSRTPMGKEAIAKAQQFSQENPRTAAQIGNVLDASVLLGPARVLSNPSGTFHKLAANTPNDLRFGRDPDTGRYQDKFYLGPKEAEQRVKDKYPEAVTNRFTPQLVKFEQMLSRGTAMGKGLGVGVANTLKQSFSPELQSKFRQQGVSKTLYDLSRKDKPEGMSASEWAQIKAGQGAYERILSSQYGKKPQDVFKSLDDEYFTYEGVFNFDDFKKLTGLSNDDAKPFFRTMLAQQKVNPGDDVVMLGRMPRATEGTGDILSDVFFKNELMRDLPRVWSAQKGFKSGNDFMQSYDRSNPRSPMPKERRKVISQAFKNNPGLADITDPKALKSALELQIRKDVGTANAFGIGNYVNDAFKARRQKSFENNDELADALKEHFESRGKDVKILRNNDQKDNKDVFLTSSVSSSAFELGGVNIVYKISPNGNVTAMTSDINDIVGIKAPFGAQALTIIPPVTQNILKTRKSKTAGQKATGMSRLYEEARKDVPVSARDVGSALVNRLAVGTTAAPVVSGMLSSEEE